MKKLLIILIAFVTLVGCEDNSPKQECNNKASFKLKELVAFRADTARKAVITDVDFFWNTCEFKYDVEYFDNLGQKQWSYVKEYEITKTK